jgi:carboxylesterase type B
MSERPFTPKDHQIAATLSSYWVNFATTGDPNGNPSAGNPSAGKGLPPWPAVTAEKAQTMEVGAEFRPIPIAGSQARVDFFRRVLAAR